jgi:hypothetical protein
MATNASNNLLFQGFDGDWHRIIKSQEVFARVSEDLRVSRVI